MLLISDDNEAYRSVEEWNSTDIDKGIIKE